MDLFDNDQLKDKLDEGEEKESVGLDKIVITRPTNYKDEMTNKSDRVYSEVDLKYINQREVLKMNDGSFSIKSLFRRYLLRRLYKITSRKMNRKKIEEFEDRIIIKRSQRYTYKFTEPIHSFFYTKFICRDLKNLRK